MKTAVFNKEGLATRVFSFLFLVCLTATVFGTAPVRGQKMEFGSDRKGATVSPETALKPVYDRSRITLPNRTQSRATNVAGGTTYTISFDAGDPIGGLGVGSVLSSQYRAATGANFYPGAFGGCGGNPTPNTCWASNTSMSIYATFPELVLTPGPGVTSASGNGLRSPNEWNFESGDPSILVTFDTPVSTFSATFAAITQAQLATVIYAFDTSGNYLTEMRQTDIASGGNQQRLTVSSTTPIGAVAMVPGSYNDFVLIDDIAFTTVGAPQAVNDRVSFTTTSGSVVAIDGACAPLGYVNRYNLNVDLRNIGANTLGSPFFQVLELQGPVNGKSMNPFRLKTADDFNTATCTGGLVGTTQAIPGPIAQGQMVPVNFQIEMGEMARFRFFVGVYAVVDEGTPTRAATARRLGKLSIEAKGTDQSGNPILSATFIPEKGASSSLSVAGTRGTLVK